VNDKLLIEKFRDDGFLVLEGFVSAEACRALMDRAADLIETFEPGDHPSIFTTHEQRRHTDRYFLDSASNISFFLEENACDADGRLVVPRERAVNKIGHAQHDLDPVYGAFSRTEDLADLAGRLGLADPLLLQSMHIFKNPEIGGEVTCHQDSTFLYTDPMTCVGFWFALEDATLENGCLQAVPGGHKAGLKSRFVREGDDVRFEYLDDTPWPMEKLVPLEVPQGTLIVLDGLLPHFSAANRSGRSRQAYSLHVIERDADYPAWNWLQRDPALPLLGFDA
jgi:phytanoyl-CoA hydroxylase